MLARAEPKADAQRRLKIRIDLERAIERGMFLGELAERVVDLREPEMALRILRVDLGVSGHEIARLFDFAHAMIRPAEDKHRPRIARTHLVRAFEHLHGHRRHHPVAQQLLPVLLHPIRIADALELLQGHVLERGKIDIREGFPIALVLRLELHHVPQGRQAFERHGIIRRMLEGLPKGRDRFVALFQRGEHRSEVDPDRRGLRRLPRGLAIKLDRIGFAPFVPGHVRAVKKRKRRPRMQRLDLVK